MATIQTPASNTHISQIVNRMHNVGYISPMEAINEFGCTRLSARISDLILIHGASIKKMRIKSTNRNGHAVCYMCYSLDGGIEAQPLAVQKLVNV